MPPESEHITRKNRIDKRLQAAGWGIVPYSDQLNLSGLANHAVEEYPTAHGPADYALFVKGALVGIVEAKKVGTNPQNVLEQAKRYASGVTSQTGNWNGFGVPFLYASNGTLIWFADVRSDIYYARELGDFHTPAAILELLAGDVRRSEAWFSTNAIAFQGIRSYQIKALEAVEGAIIAKKRHMMLAMATGTGKTFTTVAMLYRLIRSGFARRILFLVDRRALAAQAAQAFSTFTTPGRHKFNQEYEVFSQRFRKEDFEDGESFDIGVLPNAYLTRPNTAHTFVYVCTIQRMAINLFGNEGSYAQGADDPETEDDAGKIDIPIHAFDVIIADECHRGYTSQETNVWRNVLNHFDAVKIGLTATPASHTVAYFGMPVYRYTFDEAVTDGFLVDYEAVAIKSEVRIKGIFLNEGERVGLKDPASGTELIDQLEDERAFDSEEVERKITAPDSNRKIIAEIAKFALKHEQDTGRFPKILIFAVNDIPHISHADQLVQIVRETFGRGDDFVQKITGSPSVDRPLEKIRRFRNRPKPAVVVTVDMLSTGVDIPALEYLVFLRPVKSRILWTQMLGRGTRKCTDINKGCFTVFDCFNGTLIEYFKGSTDFVIDLQENGESVSVEQIIENIWENIEREYNTNRLIRRLRRVADTMSARARTEFAAYIPDGDMASFAGQLKERLKEDFMGTMEILRNKGFQELLHTYDRAKTPFYVAYQTQDEVSSEFIFRVEDKQYKPQDYLAAFSDFVHRNKDHIEAMSILLSKPAGWNTRVLKEIRKELAKHHFDEDNLRKAHSQSGHKALADIISMVKNADDGQNPLLTAEERVNLAMQRITEKFGFNEEQRAWLQYIHDHLVINLAIDSDNFDVVPVLERHGGLSKARKVFGDIFNQVIEELNYQIAA